MGPNASGCTCAPSTRGPSAYDAGGRSLSPTSIAWGARRLRGRRQIWFLDASGDTLTATPCSATVAATEAGRAATRAAVAEGERIAALRSGPYTAERIVEWLTVGVQTVRVLCLPRGPRRVPETILGLVMPAGLDDDPSEAWYHLERVLGWQSAPSLVISVGVAVAVGRRLDVDDPPLLDGYFPGAGERVPALLATLPSAPTPEGRVADLRAACTALLGDPAACDAVPIDADAVWFDPGGCPRRW